MQEQVTSYSCGYIMELVFNRRVECFERKQVQSLANVLPMDRQFHHLQCLMIVMARKLVCSAIFSFQSSALFHVNT